MASGADLFSTPVEKKDEHVCNLLIQIYSIVALSAVVNGLVDAPTHNVITTEVASDLGELSKILGDVSVQTIPLHYG